QIKALDERYKAATLDDDGQALEQFLRLPGPELWWWRRHPRVLAGDLVGLCYVSGQAVVLVVSCWYEGG
ncbi:hypothetical protein PUR35_01265, partial [Streptomyces sp. JV184]|nr:hypothetical protein [Streptomyces sp. JV184]